MNRDKLLKKQRRQGKGPQDRKTSDSMSVTARSTKTNRKRKDDSNADSFRNAKKKKDNDNKSNRKPTKKSESTEENGKRDDNGKSTNDEDEIASLFAAHKKFKQNEKQSEKSANGSASKGEPKRTQVLFVDRWSLFISIASLALLIPAPALWIAKRTGSLFGH